MQRVCGSLFCAVCVGSSRLWSNRPPQAFGLIGSRRVAAQMDAEASSETKAASPKASPPASFTDEPAAASPKGPKRKTAAQTKALNEAFAKKDTIGPEACAKLAASTGLTEKEVRQFFTHKRQRAKNASGGESKKRKGKDDGKSGPAKKKAAAAAGGKSPKSKPVKATAAQTAAAIKAIEAIHGPPRIPVPSQGTPQGEPEEVAALKAEVQQLKQELASAKSELDALKAAPGGSAD